MNTRLEKDSIGTMEVPADAYYGVQTLRALQNFSITGRKMHPEFIRSMVRVKKAAAITNFRAGSLDHKIADAIVRACDEILDGKLMDQFPLDPVQGGAGTSANMNANEVIANRAIELLGGEKGDYTIVHPNDHVNMSQSTNDVIPTSGKLTVLHLLPETIHQLERLKKAFMDKSEEFDGILKMARTQLQDAVPMRLGQSFHAFASVLDRDIYRLNKVIDEMRTVNLGATAVGTAINVPPYYLSNIVPALSTLCGIHLTQAADLFDGTQNLDGFVTISGALKTCAISLSKISNDLRLLSSGPRTGVAEINLPARQNGSSIMPGKINPVIPEVVSQTAFLVIGHDSTINLAAEAGQLELNAFEPVLFFELFEAIDAMTGAISALTDYCVQGITANEDACQAHLEASVGISTALCPKIGYQQAADLAKESLKTGVPLRTLVLSHHLLNEQELDTILDPAAMTEPHYQDAPAGAADTENEQPKEDDSENN